MSDEDRERRFLHSRIDALEQKLKDLQTMVCKIHAHVVPKAERGSETPNEPIPKHVWMENLMFYEKHEQEFVSSLSDKMRRQGHTISFFVRGISRNPCRGELVMRFGFTKTGNVMISVTSHNRKVFEEVISKNNPTTIESFLRDFLYLSLK